MSDKNYTVNLTGRFVAPSSTLPNEAVTVLMEHVANTDLHVHPADAFLNVKQLEDYLFEMQFAPSKLDYAAAAAYYELPPTTTEDVLPAGSCSGAYLDGLALRQLDWYYDRCADVLVRVVGDEDLGTHKSMGIASGMPHFTKNYIESGVYDKRYQYVPFAIVDGINDAGVYIQSNVTPRKQGDINVPHTATPYRGKLATNMIPRAVLDYAGSVTEVPEVLSHFDIFRSPRLPSGYDSHLLIADKQGNHAVLEFAQDGRSFSLVSNATDRELISNFSCDAGITEETLALDYNEVNILCPDGNGLERWELMVDVLNSNATTSEKMLQLRNKLLYSNSYKRTTNPFWLTEYAGMDYTEGEVTGKLTVAMAKTNPERFEAAVASNIANFEARTRDDGGKTWHTVHSVIFDLNNLKMNVAIQERSTSRDFKLNAE